MNNLKSMCVSMILSLLLLVGCASTKQVKELSIEIQKLDKKVDQVNNSIDILKPEIEKAKKDAYRANKRLDNKVSFYRK